MEMQLRSVSKEEAYKIIDEIPGDRVMVLKYNNAAGISGNRKYVKKKKGKNFVDKSKTVVLVNVGPIMVLNLYDKIISDLTAYDKQELSRSIMFAKGNIAIQEW